MRDANDVASVLTDAVVREFSKRLERGETSISREHKLLGVHKDELRGAMVRVLGERLTGEIIQRGMSRRVTLRRKRLKAPGDPSGALSTEDVLDLMHGVPVEVPLGETRLLLVQIMAGSLIRLASGRRSERAQSDAVYVGGSILIPTDELLAVIKAVEKAIRTETAPRA